MRFAPLFILGMFAISGWATAPSPPAPLPRRGEGRRLPLMFVTGGDKKLAPDPKLSTEREWTVDDVVLAEEAGGLELASDGKHAVWLKRSPDKDKNEMIAHL